MCVCLCVGRGVRVCVYGTEKNRCTSDSYVLLLRGQIQEINCMMLVNFKHGLFLTCTHKSHYIYRSFIAIFTRCTAFPPDPTSLHFNKTTPLFLLGEPASLLVVTNTHPPLSLVRQQLLTLCFAPLTLSHHTVQITLFT
jgi:hypothetical protein